MSQSRLKTKITTELGRSFVSQLFSPYFLATWKKLAYGCPPSSLHFWIEDIERVLTRISAPVAKRSLSPHWPAHGQESISVSNSQASCSFLAETSSVGHGSWHTVPRIPSLKTELGNDFNLVFLGLSPASQCMSVLIVFRALLECMTLFSAWKSNLSKLLSSDCQKKLE